MRCFQVVLQRAGGYVAEDSSDVFPPSSEGVKLTRRRVAQRVRPAARAEGFTDCVLVTAWCLPPRRREVEVVQGFGREDEVAV